MRDNNNKDLLTPTPETIFNSRHDFQGCLQYLVKWTDTSNVQNTRELAVHLQTYEKTGLSLGLGLGLGLGSRFDLGLDLVLGS